MTKKKKSSNETGLSSAEVKSVKPPKVKWEKAFKSNWGAGEVTLPQFIAETMCARRAAWLKEKITPRFWQDDGDWAKEFKAQITHANKVLGKFPHSCVIETINKTKWCFSLGNPKILAEIASKARTYKSIVETSCLEPETSATHGVGPDLSGLPEVATAFVANKSTMDRLKEME